MKRYRKAGSVLALLAASMLLLAMQRGSNDIVLGLIPPPGSPGDGPVEFSVMTYNIQTRPWLDDAREKLPLISPLLNGFDVVAIQECFQRHDLLWAGANYPNKAYFGAYSRPWKLANSGLSMMAGLPVKEVVAEHYEDTGELQNRVASKGIQLMRVVVNGLPVDVYNTHMEAGDRPEAQEARSGQARQVVRFVNAQSPPDHSVIITGDFNMAPVRPGKVWDASARGHYSSEADMTSRAASFEIMREGLALSDADDVLCGPVKEDIERFLYRPGAGHVLEPVEVTCDSTTYRRSDGSQLSDGCPKIARFRIAAKR